MQSSRNYAFECGIQWRILGLLKFNVADFKASNEETTTTALSANPAVVVPLLTINGWILMQRKVQGGSVSWYKTWAAYRDGFGSAAGNDNYWLGLDKVHRLVQMGNVTLRVEVDEMTEQVDLLHKVLAVFCSLFYSKAFTTQIS